MLPDKIPLLTKRLEIPQMANVYKRHVKIRKRIPVLMTSHAYARSSAEEYSGASQSGKSGIRFFHNLVNALAAKVVRICNLTKRHSLAAHVKNFGISTRIRRGPWLQWTPLPAWKASEDFHLFCRKHRLLLALADVPNPRSDGNLFSVKNFNMYGRDSGMTGAFGELSQRCYVSVESSAVVHRGHNRT
jgi:hypothetical protein